MTIKWDSSCPKVDEGVDYTLTIVDTVTDATTNQEVRNGGRSSFERTINLGSAIAVF